MRKLIEKRQQYTQTQVSRKDDLAVSGKIIRIEVNYEKWETLKTEVSAVVLSFNLIYHSCGYGTVSK